MMKHFYLFCIAVLCCTASFAQSTITLVSSDGTWDNSTDWNPQRLPSSGDVIVIPTNKTLKVSRNVSASDIHLQIYGKVSLADNGTQVNLTGNSDITIFKGGSIVGNDISQKLRINSAMVYEGSDPAVVGPAIATAALPSFTTPSILPVKFTGFSLSVQNGSVLIQWSTAEEVNASAYHLESSTDGSTWTKIATVAARGNTTSLTNYSYTDKNVAAPVVYYRIRQVDVDGQYTYTPIKSVKTGATSVGVNVAAINNRVVLQFSGEVKGAVEVRLVSLSGQVVSRQVISQPLGQVVLNSVTVKGAYIVSVSNAADINLAKQVML